MRIIPAILANNFEDFQRMIREAGSFTDYVQLDFMDGKFVPSKSIDTSELAKVKTSLRTEAHLMVRSPEGFFDALKNFGVEKVLFHYEALSNPARIIKKLKDQGFKVGLAVNPETSVFDIENLAGEVDSVLFLAVNPGFYGKEFIPEVLDKVKELKRKKPHLDIGIDGGIKLNNVEKIMKAGADFACVGSAIFDTKDPAKSFRSFNTKVKQRG
ncbi:MAG: ribulose-phosphate 3-epimerase [Actinomycetota bacterium]